MPKYLWNTNFFEWVQAQEDHCYDAIITDPPYTSYRNSLGESLISDESFDIERFCKEVTRILKKDGIFVSFCSIHLLKDYFNFFKDTLPFRCEQIWDKRPTRTWISYSRPLRHCEYIVYFGGGQLDFRTGEIGDKYRRSQFGGGLKNTLKNTKGYSEGQYEQIISCSVPAKNKNNLSAQNEFDLYSFVQNGGDLHNNNQNTKGFDKKSNLYNSHPTRKSPDFSEYFANVLQHPKKVLDPCCGSGALICSFPDAIGIDIRQWQPVDPNQKTLVNERSLDDFLKKCVSNS